MFLQFLVYFSFLLFLLGIFGTFYSHDMVSLIISFQIIIISSVVNFLSFSQFLYQISVWDKVFILLGISVIYIFGFFIVFYSYSNINYINKMDVLKNFRLFELNLSSWWGEDIT